MAPTLEGTKIDDVFDSVKARIDRAAEEAIQDVRVMAWVKGFASFKPGIKGVQWAWEPIIVCGGRPREERLHCVRDWIQESMTIKRGFRGAKPEGVCFWLFDVLNLLPSDEFHDVFPGSGAVMMAWDKWRTRSTPEQFALI